MHYKEIIENNLRGIILSRDNERTFHCKITVDIHSEKRDALFEAERMVYVEALMAGCKAYTREEFLNAINLIGASIAVDVADGFLTLSLTSLDTHQDKLLSLAKEMLTSPVFNSKELTRIKQLSINELHEEKENAKALSHETFVNELYGQNDRRYNFLPDSLIASISKVERKDVVALHRALFAKQWVFTLVTTPHNTQKVLKKISLLRSHFGDEAVAVKTHEPKTLSGRSVVLTTIPSKQNIEISIGGSLPLLLPSTDYYAFVFGMQVLGRWGGFAGRLMSTVREKEGLTYGIYSRTETTTKYEQGYWKIMTFFSADKVIQGISSTLREVERIKTKGITKTEYERFKTIIRTGEVLLMDSILKSASNAHSLLIKGFTYEEIEEHKRKLLDISHKEISDALSTYLDLSNIVIAAAGPTSSKEKELRALARVVKKQK